MTAAAGLGKGKGGMKRMRLTQIDAMQGISKPSIRRLARRGGVKRIAGVVYDEIREVLRVFLEGVIHDSVCITELSRRKTVTALDVITALKVKGRALYGFGG